MGPKMVVFGENGVYMLNYQFGIHQKAHPCEVPRLLMFLRQSRCGRLGCRRLEEPKKTEKKSRDKGVRKIAHMRRNETPYPICIKFCMVIGIHDVIIQTNFGYDRLRDFWVAKG